MTDPTTIAPSQTLPSANGPLLKQAMAAHAKVVETTIDALLPPTTGGDARLIEAMRYATLGGGKRLRGYLAMATAGLFGVPDSQSARVAASVEMLHAYSLVHDDLPAMDDDDLRRGQPSTHRKFDEATAILAGDALQTKAFEILADSDTHESATVRIALITAFAQASGAAGMVGGQMIDMEGEGRALPLEEVRHLHALKTGCLIRYSAEAGAILGQAKPDLQQRLRSYGANIGAAFQIADDVLDATATAEELGKTAGKDEASGKSTYVALLGIEGARAEAERMAKSAIEDLAPFGEQADRLRDLAYYVIERRN
ncbi:polyprenyl synthetase family protein [Acetobacter orleanensis]|uniref:Farnesyl-diphosphate synthase n=1 Tax=Acetobacter orleanensis TaxID=104099 RepID=A0A4Y3TIF4_9PROT|nr:farnesyl diphosphate synthase [Acetobacter orleanensis]KXV63167.1 farnesyl-diphosphate synthase [Acetobacter orleanensis]PCD80202.1 polyprenyl synthetase family protein [Acetobacter orleanensis]GAN69068.1 geranylgeranyl pyrophosphate synthase [Acetobacter orleanensis JCM 7639]GBR30238.1 geranylgeranyl pyrophosphate synthase [Acetobacter orleanensis NRIC 0473]GEB81524.1 farnesyl-diphosphate synthase [Acetobacter orleanensis]